VFSPFNGTRAESFGSAKGSLIGEYQEATAGTSRCSVSIRSNIAQKAGNGYCYCITNESKIQRLAFFAFIVHDDLDLDQDKIDFELLASGLGTAASVNFTVHARESIMITSSKEFGTSHLSELSVGSNGVDTKLVPVLVIDLTQDNVDVRSIADADAVVAGLTTDATRERPDELFSRLADLNAKSALATRAITRRTATNEVFVSKLKAQFKFVDEFFDDEQTTPH